MVLRGRGPTGSLGKLTLQRDCGVRWLYQGDCTSVRFLFAVFSANERNGDFATVEQSDENDCMNEQVARALIDAELRRHQRLSYSGLTALIGKVKTKELLGEDGETYYLEIQAFWDSKKGADVRLIVAADDGGWRAYKPLTGGFIMRRDGSLV